jgi:hypothetical protein
VLGHLELVLREEGAAVGEEELGVREVEVPLDRARRRGLVAEDVLPGLDLGPVAGTVGGTGMTGQRVKTTRPQGTQPGGAAMAKTAFLFAFRKRGG